MRIEKVRPNDAFARFLGKVAPALQHSFPKGRGGVYMTFDGSFELNPKSMVISQKAKLTEYVGGRYETVKKTVRQWEMLVDGNNLEGRLLI